MKDEDIKAIGKSLFLNLKKTIYRLKTEIENIIISNEIEIPDDISNLKRKDIQMYASHIGVNPYQSSKILIDKIKEYQNKSGEEDIEDNQHEEEHDAEDEIEHEPDNIESDSSVHEDEENEEDDIQEIDANDLDEEDFD